MSSTRCLSSRHSIFFFFNDTATTEIYTLSLHDALPICSMLIIGRSFVRVSEVQNQREAEFRYALTRLRENGESIALLGGEKEERAGLTCNLLALMDSWRMVMRQWMRTTFV